MQTVDRTGIDEAGERRRTAFEQYTLQAKSEKCSYNGVRTAAAGVTIDTDGFNAIG